MQWTQSDLKPDSTQKEAVSEIQFSRVYWEQPIYLTVWFSLIFFLYSIVKKDSFHLF